MAGLLDNFSEFIKTPAGQGLLSAAFGGLAGAQRGAPLNSLGRAGMSGLMGYSNAQDREQNNLQFAQQQKLQDAQIGNYNSEIEQRKFAIARQAQIQETIKKMMGDGAPPSAGIGQFGSGSFGVMPTINGAPDMPEAPKGTWLTRLPLENVVGLKMIGGPDLTKDWELGQTGVEMKPGSVYKNGNQTTFGPPTIDKNMQLESDGSGGFKTSVVPGALKATADMTAATEGAKANFDFIDVPMGDGRTIKMSRADAVKVLSQNQPEPVDIPNRGNAQPSAQDMRAIQADIAATGNPSPTLNINSRFIPYKTSGNPVQFGSTQSPMEVGQQKNIIDAGGKINDTWLKTSYEPAIQAGQAAQSVIDNTQIARDAMRSMGGTGWGTDTKAAAANMLTGLGIASENAKMYASNAQVFQKAASERLWSVINNAKGPQTEGDAARAAKTYGQLGNTTNANEFIFDLAQANAEREKAKAAFYNNALPIAKSKGDLSEVEREWNARMPSIFNMPSMKRWNK